MGRRDDNSLELTFAFLLGGVVGATVALLFAPASGEQTRRRIKDATDEVSSNMGSIMEGSAIKLKSKSAA